MLPKTRCGGEAVPEGIEKRGKNSWSVRVYMGYDARTKKRRYVRVTIRGSYKDAQRVRAELLRQREEHRLAGRGAGRITVAEFLRQWLKGREGSLAPTSVVRYRQWLELHVIPYVGHLRLRQLTPLDVQACLTAAREKGLGPATVRYVRQVLRAALQQAVEMGVIAENPCDRVKPDRQRPPQREMPSLQQIGRLLAAASGSRWGPLVMLALATGMRLGELLGLRWGDVDTGAGVIRVQRQVVYLRGQLMEGPAKAGSARAVPLGRWARQALERQRELWRQEVGRDPSPEERVFIGRRGTEATPWMVEKAFRDMVGDAGLQRLRLHDLRHLAASLMVGQGASVRAVAEVLGHRRPSITLDVYSHVLAGGGRQAVGLLDEAIEEAMSGGNARRSGQEEPV
jgi:integrase